MKRAAVLSPDFLLQAEKPLRERGFDVYAVPFCDRVDARIGPAASSPAPLGRAAIIVAQVPVACMFATMLAI